MIFHKIQILFYKHHLLPSEYGGSQFFAESKRLAVSEVVLVKKACNKIEKYESNFWVQTAKKQKKRLVCKNKYT